MGLCPERRNVIRTFPSRKTMDAIQAIVCALSMGSALHQLRMLVRRTVCRKPLNIGPSALAVCDAGLQSAYANLKTGIRTYVEDASAFPELVALVPTADDVLYGGIERRLGES